MPKLGMLTKQRDIFISCICPILFSFRCAPSICCIMVCYLQVSSFPFTLTFVAANMSCVQDNSYAVDQCNARASKVLTVVMSRFWSSMFIELQHFFVHPPSDVMRTSLQAASSNGNKFQRLSFHASKKSMLVLASSRSMQGNSLPT